MNVILGDDYADNNRKYIINCFQELAKAWALYFCLYVFSADQKLY